MTFDEIDVDALRKMQEPPLELCMMGAAKIVLQTLDADGWTYSSQSRGFGRWITEEVWMLAGDMRGYPGDVEFCGCKIGGRYDHWADRTFYSVFLAEDETAVEAQPLLAFLRENVT